MTIVYGTGESFPDAFEEMAHKYRASQDMENSYHAGQDGKGKIEQHDLPPEPMPGGRQMQLPPNVGEINREHHVPLAASGILDENRNMVGLAIDHRIPSNPEFDNFVALHERAEIDQMRNLIDGGMQPGEAYREAHDRIATPTETAAVRAHAVRNSLDPDQYLDSYKQFWRDAASVAAEPTDRPRHPAAHTTVYGLDESEGIKTAMDMGSDISGGDLPVPSNKHPTTYPDHSLDHDKELWLQGKAYKQDLQREEGVMEQNQRVQDDFSHFSPQPPPNNPKDLNYWNRPYDKGIEMHEMRHGDEHAEEHPDKVLVKGFMDRLAMEGEEDAPLHNKPLEINALQPAGGLHAGPGPVKIKGSMKGANDNTEVVPHPVDESVKNFNRSRSTKPGRYENMRPPPSDIEHYKWMKENTDWGKTDDASKYQAAVDKQVRTSTYNSGEKWVKTMIPGYGMRYVKEKNLNKYKDQANEDENITNNIVSKVSDWVKDEFGNLTRTNKNKEDE